MNKLMISSMAVLVAVGCDAPSDEHGETDTVEVEATADPDGRRELAGDELDAARARESERATRALAEVETMFAQHDPGLTFRVHRSTTTSVGDAHVLVQQVYRGVPVEQRDILVIVRADDQIRVIGQPDRFEGVSLPKAAPLAKAQAWASRRGVTLSGTGERWLLPVVERRLRPGASGGNATDYESVVARFESGTRVPLDGHRGARELFVRDRDGSVVERGLPAQVLVDADLRGHFHQATQFVTSTESSGQYSLKDEWSNKVVLGANTLYTGADNTWGDSGLYSGGGGLSLNGETAAADAFISLWATSKMMRTVYGETTLKPTTAHVHYGATGAFASLVGSPVVSYSIELGYADFSAPVKEPLTDIEVVAHEYAHNIIEDKTGLLAAPDLGELGGVFEGSADIFGLNASFYLPSALEPRCRATKPLYELKCSWSSILGITNDWVFGNISHFPKALRSFIDPVYPAWTSALGSIDAHEASGPLRRMYYFLSVGVLAQGATPSSTANTVPQRASSYLPQGLTGVGVNVASRIWWHTIAGLYLARVEDFTSYRALMLQAATDLYGEHSTQYKAVEDAWAAVNVGQPADRTPPEVDLISGTKLSSSSYIEASASDANGVARVDFYFSAPGVGDMKQIGAATAPPWRVSTWGWPTTDTYTLTLVATDTRGNRTTKNYYPVTYDDSVPTVSLTDVTPCSPATSEWCGAYRTQRIYRVSATDFSGVSRVSLWMDGATIATQYTSSYDFVVNYTVGGDHALRGIAVDTVGNTNQTPWKTYNIDWTPPTLTRDVAIAQSQTSSGEYIDKLVEMDYCATDASGIALQSGKQRIELLMDNVARAVEERTGYPAGCPSYYIRNVPAGPHTFVVRIFDKWGNVTERTRSITVVSVKPFVYLYGAYVDPMVLGRVTVSGFYNNYGNVASITYYLCRSGTCDQQKSEAPPVGVVGAIEFDYESTNLWLGETYKARITVTGTNGTSTTVESVPFTIPTTTAPPTDPTDVVYNEVEPNDGYYWNSTLNGGYDVVPSNANVIHGSSMHGNSDMFLVTEPTNKVLCVAVARLNNSYGYVDPYVFMRRGSDGAWVYAPLGPVEDSPQDITDDSYKCYLGGWPAIDGKYYLYAEGLFTNPDDYEFRIKYISNVYRMASPSSSPTASEHYIFETSTTYLPTSFGGLAGADAQCQARGNAGSFTGPKQRTWKALLSGAGVNARDRIDWDGTRPLKNTRGETVAAAVGNAPSFWPLARSALVYYDENGATISTPYTMTGSNADGTSNGFHCASWTDPNGGTLTFGMDSPTGGNQWITYSSAQDCSVGQKRLYCVSQATLP